MTTLTLRSPADVLAAVPYLLGFHPTDSVVLLAQRGTRVVFQARTDAPDPAGIDELAAYLAEIAARQAPTAVVLIGYGPEHPVAATLDALRAAVELVGTPVTDVLRVDGGRYWSLLCADPGCCPPGGTAFDPSGSAVAAAATYGGMVALPDRATLAAGLAPLPGPGLEPELARASGRLDELVAGGARRRRAAARLAVRDALETSAAGARLDDDEVAWLAVLLQDRRARDDAWQRMLAGPPRPEHQALWRDVLRRVPTRYQPAPATLLALAAWRAGEGATASLAVERALTADPGYELAGLLLQVLRAAIPPSAIEPLPGAGRRRRGPRVRKG